MPKVKLRYKRLISYMMLLWPNRETCHLPLLLWVEFLLLQEVLQYKVVTNLLPHHLALERLLHHPLLEQG
jgi:hypothetical protein